MGILGKIFGSGDDEIVEIHESSSDEALEAPEESAEGQLALDIYHTKDNLVIKSTIAGVKPDDLDITIADDRVTIRGERKQEQEVSDEDYLMQECYWGSFYRSFDLPFEVDVDKSVADIKDGILTLILPKASRSKTKKVKVKSQME
ncbi:MAG: hypothetical protein A3C85_02415 [Candidatus Doudnabacteria bacterium RIFCSPHIGHO2_02_FULL_48_21]|uniref:Uncharacterized protein n=1 Tax=Candidatus Doudnabacteria bacterium RIFCSPLOWO2_02_FULL_48_13 TaxID=1817845 RepID=A0A1F5QCQ8_9BACT|nr:MAG: hypothetical protein A3K05_01470 [Candidatus Doudnabacteria bacterium RIFCSPHIGHO2_01_48_18]OGE79801.1 MAG: hypothetical protein A2668_02235 [Candidatus Doudnabacteria bacterium RIFCSPHIGHO2_01_FULL_48_180]OGE91524.1 MAG: hypothetical protein A3F44_02400 [Candidatus Doudnabacteria bacterium RIFCSPHIGHO2_12_FULL_47_25]OGE93992.1 MAG: hypothetical protein A3C85_02415 [Candidatus Doudnabacteria bacterium RIFCSPHIGHO2_02_FULL_48_21]OGE98034.1 MAG: hypothetical protein A3A83_02660 [Candidatu